MALTSVQRFGTGLTFSFKLKQSTALIVFAMSY